MLRPLNTFTWVDIEAMDRNDLYYVLPVSSLEQHGRHLPVGTDDFMLQCGLERLYEDKRITANMLVMPTLHYGNSHEHIDFPGTVTLSCNTIATIIGDMLKCMKRHGVKKLIVLNSHGGNTPILKAFSQEWEQEYGIRIYNVNFWASSFYAEAHSLIKAPINFEVHGGEIEASMLMYRMPEVVKTSELTPKNDCCVNLTDYYDGWSTASLSPGNGVLGAPSQSNSATGKKLVDYTAEKLANYFMSIQNDK